ncbi:MAG: hypothetical protein P8X48_04735 [Acidiferrobacteraceae bacterium]|jgi:hypothetical protein
MNGKKVSGLIAAFLLVGGLTACSRVRDPWVPNAGYLKQERQRPAPLAMHLRERVMETQIDR